MFLKRADTHILCNEYSSKESRASNTPRLVVAESRTLRIKEGDVVNIYIYVCMYGEHLYFSPLVVVVEQPKPSFQT